MFHTQINNNGGFVLVDSIAGREFAEEGKFLEYDCPY
jgi:hypothetical protein